MYKTRIHAQIVYHFWQVIDRQPVSGDPESRSVIDELRTKVEAPLAPKAKAFSFVLHMLTAYRDVVQS